MERDKARSMSATSKDEDDTAKKSKSGIAKFLTRDLALKTRDKDKEKEKDRADAETRARSLTPTSVGGDATVGVTVSQSAGVAAQSSSTPGEDVLLSFDALIAELCSPDFDPELTQALLFTYRTFCTPEELLGAIVKRFLSAGVQEDVVRIRCANFVRLWMEKHWSDFSKTQRLLDPLLRQFAADAHALPAPLNAKAAPMVQALVQRLDKYIIAPPTIAADTVAPVHRDTAPAPLVPTLLPGQTTLTLEQIDAQEMARQLTLRDHELFAAVQPWECLERAWTKPSKHKDAPNVIHVLAWHSHVRAWVRAEILLQADLTVRQHRLRYFYTLLQHVNALNNYAAVACIAGALMSPPIARLRQTWECLSRAEVEMIRSMSELTAAQRNYAALREHLRHVKPPCVPLLHMFLADLSAIDTAAAPAPEGLINVSTRKALAAVIASVLLWRNPSYRLTPVPEVRDFLERAAGFDDVTSYRLSHMLEPQSQFDDADADSSDEGPAPRSTGLLRRAAESVSLTLASAALKLSSATAAPDDADDARRTRAPSRTLASSAKHRQRSSSPGRKRSTLVATTPPKTPRGEALELLTRRELADLDAHSHQLTAISHHALLEELVAPTQRGVQLWTDFLLTYRSIFRPQDVLRFVLDKFATALTDAIAGEDAEERRDQQRALQIRVMSFVRFWIDKFWSDFNYDSPHDMKLAEEQGGVYVACAEQLFDILDEFSELVLANLDALEPEVIDAIKKLDDVIQKVVRESQADEAGESEGSEAGASELPAPMLPALEGTAQLRVTDIHPLELARQLCLLDCAAYRELDTPELLRKAWLSAERQDAAASVLRVVTRLHKVAHWVQSQLLLEESLAQRVRVLQHLLQLCVHLHDLRNFHALGAIVDGLTAPAVARLKRTFSALTPAEVALFEHLQALYSREDGYALLHSAVKACMDTLPALPYLPMYLHDVAALEDAIPETTRDGRINFVKHHLLAALLRELQSFRLARYHFRAVPHVQDFLTQYRVLDSAAATRLSKYLEPRGSATVGAQLSLLARPERPPELTPTAATTPAKALGREREVKRSVPRMPAPTRALQRVGKSVRTFTRRYTDASSGAATAAQSGSASSNAPSKLEVKPVAAPSIQSEAPVKEASLEELIELSTDARAPPQLLPEVLLTYRSFCTPSQLLAAWLHRLRHAPEGAHKELVQYRAINAVKTWITKYWFDFRRDYDAHLLALLTCAESYRPSQPQQHSDRDEDEEQPRVQQHAAQPSPQDSHSKLHKALLDLVEHAKRRQERRDEAVPEQTQRIPPPPALLPKNVFGTFKLLDVHPLELARQLTLIESELFRQIEPWEFFNQAWMSVTKERDAPNIVQLIAHFNNTNGWIKYELLSEPDPETRRAKFLYFLKVVAHLRELQNFNGILEFTSALTASSIVRLHKTIALISKADITAFDETAALVSNADNYKALRAQLRALQPPCIPYLGMYLTDLIFIEEGNRDYTASGKINFQKRHQMAQVLQEIQQYQLAHYNLLTVPYIKQYLREGRVIDDELAHRLSSHIEPKTGAPPTRVHLPEELLSAPERVAAGLYYADEEWWPHFPVDFPKGYPFLEPDSPESIVVRDERDGTQRIIGATLVKLVERLTLGPLQHAAHHAFLLSFRAYATPLLVLDLLIYRFKLGTLRREPTLSEEAWTRLERDFHDKVQQPIRTRVAQLLVLWTSEHWYDFDDDPALLGKLEIFNATCISRWNKDLHDKLALLVSAQGRAPAPAPDTRTCPPLLGSMPTKPYAECSSLDFNAEEVARQICLADHALFAKITPAELMNKSFMLRAESPVFHAFQQRMSGLETLVRTELHACEDNADAQVAVVTHWLTILSHLRDRRHWNALSGVIKGLADVLVKPALTARLSWDLQQLGCHYRDLFTDPREESKLRMQMFKSLESPPAIPYMKCVVEEINLIESVDFPDQFLIIKNKVVNFERSMAVGKVITNMVSLLQRTPYAFHVSELICSWYLYAIGARMPKRERAYLTEHDSRASRASVAVPDPLASRTSLSLSSIPPSSANVSSDDIATSPHPKPLPLPSQSQAQTQAQRMTQSRLNQTPPPRRNTSNTPAKPLPTPGKPRLRTRDDMLDSEPTASGSAESSSSGRAYPMPRTREEWLAYAEYIARLEELLTEHRIPLPKLLLPLDGED